MKCGGWLDKGRVFGVLEPSRCFGDADFKQKDNQTVKQMLQTKNATTPKLKKAALKSVHSYMYRTGKFPAGVITCVPDIHKVGLNEPLHFVIIASDGLWDVITSKKAVEFVGEKLKEEISPEKLDHLAKELCTHALELGSKDDITVVIVLFQ